MNVIATTEGSPYGAIARELAMERFKRNLSGCLEPVRLHFWLSTKQVSARHACPYLLGQNIPNDGKLKTKSS